MDLKRANYTNRFRIYMNKANNHYVIWSAIFNRSHGDIHVYLELCFHFDPSFVHHFWLAKLFFFFFQNAFTSTKEES